MTRFMPPVLSTNRAGTRVTAHVNVCICISAHASTGGPRVIRCFPRPTDRQHLLQVHALEIESTYPMPDHDAKPLSTLRSSVPRVLFRAPLLQNVAPTLSSVYIRILILPKIIHHSKKPMGSTLIERIEFERICCNIFEKTLVEGLFNWLLQRLFSNGSTVSRKILKPIRRLNCGGNSW